MLTSGDLSYMDQTQQLTMLDECIILDRVSGDIDEYGKPVESFESDEAGTTSICGLDEDPKKEGMVDTEVALLDAQVRLPLETSIPKLGRIKVTKRFGSALADPILFDILGMPRQGPSALVVDLTNVKTGE